MVPSADDLISQQVVELVAAADEMGLAVLYKHFGWFIAGVEIGGHLETVGAGVVKDQVIALAHFVDGAIPGEGIGLADIADDGILFWRRQGC